MNHFELFELPLSLKVELSYNTKKYYALSRLFHPDNFTLSDEKSKQDALEKSTQINKAKKILDNEYLRLAYILSIKEVIEEEEKYELPVSFLSEMMDINEELMDLELEPDEEKKAAIQKQIDQFQEFIKQPVKQFFKVDILNANEKDLEALKLYYYQQKYLNRLMEKL